MMWKIDYVNVSKENELNLIVKIVAITASKSMSHQEATFDFWYLQQFARAILSSFKDNWIQMEKYKEAYIKTYTVQNLDYSKFFF